MILEFIRAVFESFMRAIIRFWDNRFQKSDEVEYLRMELSKLQSRYDEMILSLTQPVSVESQIPAENYQPVVANMSWDARRRELERKSYEEYQRQQAAKQTIEELENAVGITKES